MNLTGIFARTTGLFSLYKHLFPGCGGFTAEETLCRAAAIRLVVQVYFRPYLISFVLTHEKKF
jgi:hypothetical protein